MKPLLKLRLRKSLFHCKNGAVYLAAMFVAVSCREDISGRSGDHFTKLSGAYSQDIILKEFYSPYLVVGDFGLFEGSTLTIEPGVTVAFDLGERTTASRLNIVMEGNIMAQGSDHLPIRFVPVFDEEERLPGDWGSIQLIGNGQTSIFEHCEFLFPKIGIHAVNHRLVIEDCLFEFADTSDTSSGIGVLVANTDSVVVRRSTFMYNRVGFSAINSAVFVDSSDFLSNTSDGMLLEGSTVQIRGCLVRNNLSETIGTGLRLLDLNGLISGSEFSGNLYGIQLEQNSGNLQISFNNLYENSEAGFNVLVRGATVSTDMRFNYWGFPADSVSSIVQTISDTQFVRIWPVQETPFVIR